MAGKRNLRFTSAASQDTSEASPESKKRFIEPNEFVSPPPTMSIAIKRDSATQHGRDVVTPLRKHAVCSTTGGAPRTAADKVN